MIEIRKGRKGEDGIVLDAINRAFKPYRPDWFNFKSFMPKIYDNNLDFSKYHHILIKDGSVVSVVGNIINTTLDNKYKYSLIGSVATIPGHVDHGYMKRLMASADNENLNDGVDFSVLTGARIRYNYYGYEECTIRCNYIFDSHFKIHNKGIYPYTLKEYSENENKAYYELYLNNQPVTMRTSDNFKISLAKRDSKIIGIYDGDNLIGYFDEPKGTISELTLSRYNDINSLIALIMNKYNLDSLNIMVSPLYKEMIEALDKYASKVKYQTNLHIKVYNIINFLSYIINLNLKNKYIDKLNLVYKIDDEVIEININDNKLNIGHSNKEYIREFNKLEFIRYIFNLMNHDNLLFPLYFDILEADLF